MKTAKQILNELKTRHPHLEQVASSVGAKTRGDLRISLIEEIELKNLLEELWSKFQGKAGSPFGLQAMQIAIWLNSFAGAYPSGEE